MTTVAIDAVGAKRGGAARIACEAALALAAHEGFDEVVVFASAAPERAFDFPTGSASNHVSHHSIRVVEQPGAESALGRLAWIEEGLESAVAAAQADVLLALNAVGNVGRVPVVNYYQQPLLYDDASLGLVGGETRLRMSVIRSLTQRAARAAAGHVVQTDWMRSRVSQAWELSPNQIEVATPAPPGWEPSVSARTSDLLWVGHELGYKRWGMARQIHQAWRRIAPDARLFATLSAADGAADGAGVEALGSRPWDELEDYYHRVGALLVTSTTESLGLPLLEALATRCPIVAADYPWVRAVCDNAALYYSPDDAHQAVERLRDLQRIDVYDDLLDRMTKRCEAIRRHDGWGRLAATVAALT